MLQHSGHFIFRVDPQLSAGLRKNLEELLSGFKEAQYEEFSFTPSSRPQKLTVDFVSENSLHLLRKNEHFKICVLDSNQGLFSFGQNIEGAEIDAILDDSLDIKQLECLLLSPLGNLLSRMENDIFQKGLKNLKKFESRAREAALKSDEGLYSPQILDFAQVLVDLEKELIHAGELSRMEKILKQFAKAHIEKVKLGLYPSSQLWKITPSSNLLALPRFKGEFVTLELNWDDEEPLRLIKKFFFLHTLVSFFLSQQEIKDPFFDEKLWEGLLDGIPFPVALLSESAEVYQHNTLFAKLGFPPVDCLRLKVREKIMVNDIPYNIFRKDIQHLGEKKILFVFFTESFFLKGDGNFTPTGQELGIISSSIAHELNNPIAGIQAALGLLMLDQDLNQEAMQTLKEMKNGATRCKQLIETFLGFSRVNPRPTDLSGPQVSPIGVCYEQAQNLLRFRTVESGIRFSIEYSKHSDFRPRVNLSLLTMTFYLIMGELMTLYSHHLLVADKNQIEKVIKGELVESSQEIQLQLHELNISSLNLSKLIQNLLTIENFVLQTTDYSLRFIHSPR